MKAEEFTNIPKEKFALVNENKKLHDKELVTKPIGFFKDAMHRFAKNKGSIVGAAIIGILVLYAIIAPMFSPYTVSYRDSYYSRTLPRLFTSENIDFLDGGKNQTGNVAQLIKYYSMGLETGHNAIKRQAYSYDKENDSYSYRVDTYQSIGTVFMSSISLADYTALQNYQDEHNVQIIYPITDPTKRPSSQVNATDANFWYQTKPQGSNDVPDNYKINDDGTIELTNIYQEYSIPVMAASSNSAKVAYTNLVAKDSGYAIKISKDVESTDDKGETIITREVLGYISAQYADEVDSTFLVETFDEASVFAFDSVHKTLLTYIGGHSVPSRDGYYYFGLNATRGSTVELISESNLGLVNYIPFSLYLDGTIVDSVDTTSDYIFAANRISYDTTNVYAGVFFENGFIKASSLNRSAPILLEKVDGGYKLKSKLSGYYLNAIALGDVSTMSSTNVKEESTTWTFDAEKHGLKATITGHIDASLDGDYYICSIDKNNIGLVKSSDINSNNVVLTVVDSSLSPITAPMDDEEYRLYVQIVDTINNMYYVNGTFKGDHYHSKMRIEGEGNYVYSYAIQKDGDAYEIRVNYYEYYCYYHSEILHDRIDKPYFLFGTNASGQDIFTCLASGARFSFVMAIVVATVNMLIGAIYGAIEGYYGGKVDMVMERIVEILSAVPFMIVITLLKYHMGGSSQALILFIAFFLTGWIGESGTVRMQFYRFKNQEYVLAARTLGAKDWRIMFKHIFPNSLGTIITGSVLVIPGMIFSETSLSYLGIINLNTGSMTSVGTLLAAGQPYLVSYPHMILFPAIFISLLMLCFNLFGNGLRDAFNPSLRGTED